MVVFLGMLAGCGPDVRREVEPNTDNPAASPRAIAAAGTMTCVLADDQSVSCFGGAIGKPNRIPFSAAAEVAVGPNRICVRTVLGRVECVDVPHWGMPQPLGAPVEMPGIDDAIQISLGQSHACVLHEGGLVECWGDNSLGQLGNGSFDSTTVPTPVGIGPVRSVTAGELNTCVLTDAGVYCWGRGGYGALGNGSTASPDAADEQSLAATSPVQVVGLVDPTQVSAGLNHACAVDEPGGIAKCWGWSVQPEIADLHVATAIEGVVEVTSVYSGYLVNCGIRTDGGANCWGTGYLGNGSAEPTPTVAEVLELRDIQSIVGGWSHNCALVANGEVYCWGGNGFDQLGTGTKDDIALAPQRVPL